MRKVIAYGTTVAQENWYDASSRRIAQKPVGSSAFMYLYDGWNIVAVLNSSGALLETFTRGVGLAGDIGTLVAITRNPIAQYPGAYYLQNNHRGDVTHVRNGTTTSTTYRYSAFGELKGTTGTDLCRFKFSSKERDLATGLSYYGYRFYAPQWQRWVSADPIREVGGLNLYRLVSNNPMNSVDSNGLQAPGIPGGWGPPPPPYIPCGPLGPAWNIANYEMGHLEYPERHPFSHFRSSCRFLCPPGKCPQHLVPGPEPCVTPPPPWPGNLCSTCGVNNPPPRVLLVSNFRSL